MSFRFDRQTGMIFRSINDLKFKEIRQSQFWNTSSGHYPDYLENPIESPRDIFQLWMRGRKNQFLAKNSSAMFVNVKLVAIKIEAR